MKVTQKIRFRGQVSKCHLMARPSSVSLVPDLPDDWYDAFSDDDMRDSVDVLEELEWPLGILVDIDEPAPLPPPSMDAFSDDGREDDPPRRMVPETPRRSSFLGRVTTLRRKLTKRSRTVVPTEPPPRPKPIVIVPEMTEGLEDDVDDAPPRIVSAPRTTVSRNFGIQQKRSRSMPPLLQPVSPTYDQYLVQHDRIMNDARTPLSRWLADRSLSQYEPKLTDMGVRKLRDLAYLTDEDLLHMNVLPSQRLHFQVHVVA